jgi:hypothetical protein
MKQQYTLTKEQHATLLEASQPTPVMGISENAMIAWRALGEEMKFDPETVEPSPFGDRFFLAEPL